MNKQKSTEESWKNLKYIFYIAIAGLWWGFIGIVALVALLQWILEIDITKLDTFPRLLIISWGVCSVLIYIIEKNKEEKIIQKQLDKLRRKEIVEHPHSKLIERYKQEQKDESLMPEGNEKR